MKEANNDEEYFALTEGFFDKTTFDLIKKWKTSNEKDRIKKFKSSSVTPQEASELKEMISIMRDKDVEYNEYKKAFKKFCTFIHTIDKGVIIRTISLTKNKDDDNYTLYVEYADNTKKIRLPDDCKLYHITKTNGIRKLLPSFKGKSQKGYLYDKPRIYFTIRKKMPKFLADYKANDKMYTYECMKDIKDVYIDPLVPSFIQGAVYIETQDPIPVEQVGLKSGTNDTEKVETKNEAYMERYNKPDSLNLEEESEFDFESFFDMVMECGLELVTEDDELEDRKPDDEKDQKNPESDEDDKKSSDKNDKDESKEIKENEPEDEEDKSEEDEDDEEDSEDAKDAEAEEIDTDEISDSELADDDEDLEDDFGEDFDVDDDDESTDDDIYDDEEIEDDDIEDDELDTEDDSMEDIDTSEGISSDSEVVQELFFKKNKKSNNKSNSSNRAKDEYPTSKGYPRKGYKWSEDFDDAQTKEWNEMIKKIEKIGKDYIAKCNKDPNMIEALKDAASKDLFPFDDQYRGLYPDPSQSINAKYKFEYEKSDKFKTLTLYVFDPSIKKGLDECIKLVDKYNLIRHPDEYDGYCDNLASLAARIVGNIYEKAQDELSKYSVKMYCDTNDCANYDNFSIDIDFMVERLMSEYSVNDTELDQEYVNEYCMCLEDYIDTINESVSEMDMLFINESMDGIFSKISDMMDKCNKKIAKRRAYIKDKKQIKRETKNYDSLSKGNWYTNLNIIIKNYTKLGTYDVINNNTKKVFDDLMSIFITNYNEVADSTANPTAMRGALAKDPKFLENIKKKVQKEYKDSDFENKIDEIFGLSNDPEKEHKVTNADVADILKNVNGINALYNALEKYIDQWEDQSHKQNRGIAQRNKKRDKALDNTEDKEEKEYIKYTIQAANVLSYIMSVEFNACDRFCGIFLEDAQTFFDENIRYTKAINAAVDAHHAANGVAPKASKKK